VRATDKLIKFKWNGDVVEKGPGIQFYWPILTEIEEITVVRQPLKISEIRLVTKDFIPCVVDTVVIYEITDCIQFITKNYDGFLALSESVSATLRTKLSSMTFKEIQGNEDVNSALTQAVGDDIESFGIEVEYVRLQDFTWCIPLSIVSNSDPVFKDMGA
jgi:regulator of protease activity HflC (stomatin/prohibitin superfamily)